MKIKNCVIFILVIIVIGTLFGCKSSADKTESVANETESLFAELNVDYTTNDDGTYSCRGYDFNYKLEVSGIEGESQVTFVVLTNDLNIDFEEVRYGLIKPELDTGSPQFIILGWY